jgi:MATE family multidrug resistance protein
VAGHQIAANLVSVLFMLPMALASATSTLVAQRIGCATTCRRAPAGRHGIVLGTGWPAAPSGTVVFWAAKGVVGCTRRTPR